MLDALTLRRDAVGLGKDGDEIGRDLEEGLVGVGAKWSEGFFPLLGGAACIKLALFRLGPFTNARLDRGVADHDKMPRLLVGPIGRGACGAQAILDDAARHRAGGKVAHTAPPPHFGIEIRGALLHLCDGIFTILR